MDSSKEKEKPAAADARREQGELRRKVEILESVQTDAIQLLCFLQSKDWPFIFSAPMNGGDFNSDRMRELTANLARSVEAYSSWPVPSLSQTPTVEGENGKPAGWIKTAERPPTEKDTDKDGCVLMRNRIGEVQTIFWKRVVEAPEIALHWKSVPRD